MERGDREDGKGAKGDTPISSLVAQKHLVRMTTLCRGISYFFNALPTISSDAPLEYMLAVSHVLMPMSYAALSSATPYHLVLADWTLVPCTKKRHGSIWWDCLLGQ